MRMKEIQPDMFTQKRGVSCVEAARVLPQCLDGELDTSHPAMVAVHLRACRRSDLDEKSFREIKSALARRRHGLAAEPIVRLRRFAAGLAASDADLGEGRT